MQSVEARNQTAHKEDMADTYWDRGVYNDPESSVGFYRRSQELADRQVIPDYRGP